MKAQEIIDRLFSAAEGDYVNSCDTVKAGSTEAEVTKIAVSMFATPDTIRRASEWGANLFIVHEPTYYNHMDAHTDDPIETEKRNLLMSTGMVLVRWHDHAHREKPDAICRGEMTFMALNGKVTYQNERFDMVRVRLDKPTTPRELAAILEERLSIAHIRICGAADTPCTLVTGMFGTPGGTFDELKSDNCEILMTGEACEWSLGEYSRDAAQLGHKKALLILGHIPSERDGMRLLAEDLTATYPSVETKYFECGEVYTYTDR